MDITKIDWSHLRPPISVMKVQHNDHYIRHGQGKKSIRKIFSNVEHTIDDFEREKIKEMEQAITSEYIQLPSDWTTSETLKYCYSSKFDIPKCLIVLKRYLQWRLNPESYIVDEGVIQELKRGVIYLEGRDHEYRPVIVINVTQINLKDLNAETKFIKGLGVLLYLVKKYTWVPGKVENWIVIIETGGMGLIGFPFGILKKLIEFTMTNFTSSLEKLYILNPSFGLNTSWNIIKGMLDPETAAKISFIKSSNIKDLRERISPNQLEKKYGGDLPNFTEFWPPKYLPEEPQIQLSLLFNYTSDDENTNNNNNNNPLDRSDLTIYYDCEDVRVEYNNDSRLMNQNNNNNNNNNMIIDNMGAGVDAQHLSYKKLNKNTYNKMLEENKEYSSWNRGLNQNMNGHEAGYNAKDNSANKLSNGNIKNDDLSPLKASFSRKSGVPQSENHIIIYEGHQTTKSSFCGFCTPVSNHPSPVVENNPDNDSGCNIF